MRKTAFFLLGALLALGAGAWAASGGGLPSRPVFQSVGIGQAPHSDAGTLVVAGGWYAEEVGDFNTAYSRSRFRPLSSSFQPANRPNGPNWVAGIESAYGPLGANYKWQLVSGAGARMLYFREQESGTWTSWAEIAPHGHGTFSAAITGCTTAPSYDFAYVKIGNHVTVSITNNPGLCTSNATAKGFAAGTLPAAIRPTASRCTGAIAWVDNAAGTLAQLRMGTDGAINVQRINTATATGCSGTNHTASGTNGGAQTSWTYTIH